MNLFKFEGIRVSAEELEEGDEEEERRFIQRVSKL
jgi:hypothetical protein